MTGFYRHTGEITVKGIILGLVSGMVTAFVLSLPYAYITVYVPLVYVNILATLGFAFFVGASAGKAARKGGLQSSRMYVFIGLVSGATAEYFNWVFWIWALTRQRILTFDPRALLAVARQIMEEGTWGLSSGGPLSGVPLLLVWIIEALMLAGFAAYTCRQGLTKFICCPACSTWFDKPTRALQFVLPEGLQDVVEKLSQLKLECLRELPPADLSLAIKYLEVDLFFCPSCSGFGCMTVKKVEIVRKKKETETKEEILIDRILIPMTQLSELMGASTPAAVSDVPALHQGCRR